jgi:hypothetical protein
MDANVKNNVIVGGRVVGWVEVPADQCGPDLWKRVVRYQFLYSVFGLLSGLLCVIMGVLMFTNGIMGTGHWSANILGMTLTDAPAGVVLFVIGLALVQVTAFTVKTKDAVKNIVIGGKVIGWVEVPADQCGPELWQLVIHYQFLYSVFGLVSGLLCVLMGVLMFANGVLGSGHWSANILGMTLTDSPVGVALFVVGVAMVQVTAFTVKVKDAPQPPKP